MAFSNNCSCCGCKDICNFKDDYTSVKSYQTNGDTFSVTTAALPTGGTLSLPVGKNGSYYQQMDLKPVQLGRRIIIKATVQKNGTTGDQTSGLFIGKGVAFLATYSSSGTHAGQMLFSLNTGVDEFGNGGTAVDIGAIWFNVLGTSDNKAYPIMTLSIQSWLGADTYECFIGAVRQGLPTSGSLIEHFFRVTLTLDQISNIGFVSAGGGSFKHLCITTNRNAILRCNQCISGIACSDDATWPVAYSLSVGSIGSEVDCAGITAIVGDWTLYWYPGSCSWNTDQYATLCSSFQFMPMWQLKSGFDSSFVDLVCAGNSYLYRRGVTGFRCDTAITLTRVVTIGYNPSSSPPATLTVIPVYR